MGISSVELHECLWANQEPQSDIVGWICRQEPGLEEAEDGARAEPLVAGEADSLMHVPLTTFSTYLMDFALHCFPYIFFLSQSQYITFKCHGIYTLNEWTLWYVNYISIRLLKMSWERGPFWIMCSRKHNSPYTPPFLNLLGEPAGFFRSFIPAVTHHCWAHPYSSLVPPWSCPWHPSLHWEI